MQNYGYRFGKKINKMKDNTLEHLFDFAPRSGMVKLNENKFLETKKYETIMN